MSESLSPGEVSKEIAKHEPAAARADDRVERLLTIAEVALLSVVAVLAAWSGYHAARWNTDSGIALAEASITRTKANRAQIAALTQRNYDSSTFEAWFAAYVAGDERAQRIAIRRFREPFKVAFDAWQATSPETNPRAAKGPTYMPEYRQPTLARAALLDRQADAAFHDGVRSGANVDKYVRLTVVLASILFLVGISTQFRVRGVRVALVTLSTALLVFSLVQIGTLPRL